MGLFSKSKKETQTYTPYTVSWAPVYRLLRAVEKKAVEFQRRKTTEPAALGTSKIGGKPHLSEGFEWPYYEGAPYGGARASRPLAFIAQINLSEVSSFEPEGKLPNSGFLYFFYELVSMPWGNDVKDKGCARVFYFDAAQEDLRVTEYPDDLDPDCRVPEFAIEFNSVWSVPSFEEFAEDVFVTFEDYESAVDEMDIDFDMERPPESVFKLLGYADLIQGSILPECPRGELQPMPDSWEQMSASRLTEIHEKREKWILLAQFGTISDSIMFGDCGCIYFYIRKSDLKKRCFDKIHLSLQCY